MKQVLQVRLLPTPEQASALLATLHTCNTAANWVSERANAQQIFGKFRMQKAYYRELRSEFGLAAQPAILVIRKVAAAYARDRTRRHRWRRDSAQAYDVRCLSLRFVASGASSSATASIWTVRGRLTGIRVLGEQARGDQLRGITFGESDLIHRRGVWLLALTREVEAVTCRPPADFLGVDMGVVNIATTSDGVRYSGSRLNRYRRRQVRLRQRLQTKGTRSARRLLKRRNRKERRFATDVNHVISKSIVAEAERTGRGIAVEQLAGIRERVRLRKPQRAALHQWAFHQLGRFLGYKAAGAGVVLVEVDPAFTSQTCRTCRYVSSRNRRSQAVFMCGGCGFVGHADHNAAGNIADRGIARWGEVMRPHAAPTLAAS
ncbi:RNA-guided endonuclease TnpB family protein [Kutzneria buriramensis]|uniref:RNA-guided endonuclease InsQ/TnpB family protein n=1 Tax=Kutzneria buriramensis TaxID=1045776 RepID=UPI000E234921|nr:RNA-guided endonuclease TnpB family protein [Kutzneria buriramensis]